MRPLNIAGVLYVLVEEEVGSDCSTCVFTDADGKWCNKLTSTLISAKHNKYACSRTTHYKRMEVEDIPNMTGKPINVKLGNWES